MGMGYGANFSLTITVEQVAEHNIEFARLLVTLAEWDVTVDEVFRYIVEEDDYLADEGILTHTEWATIKERLEAVLVQFEEEFGIELMIDFHDSAGEGSEFDDIDGAHFWVRTDQFYTKTKAAIKLEKHFEVRESAYVTRAQ